MKISNTLKSMAGLLAILLLSQSNGLAQQLGASGELKWLRINSLHTYFSEQAAETETGGTEETNITFSWPGEYGIDQYTMRANGIWLGCRNYYDSKVDRSFDKMVTNCGLKPNEYTERPIADAYDFRLVGKYPHPIVNVDGALASNLTYYDVLDDIDPTLPSDRLLIVKNHTSIGVDIIKKVYAWSTSGHDDYYIYDFVLKNTGIIDNEGTENPQTINDFYFLLAYRYTLAGESIISGDPYGTNWGTGAMQWGGNVVNDVVGTDPTASDFDLRAQVSWYGPNSAQPVSDDWGCPNYKDDGVMAAAKYVGRAVLHADKSVQDQADDLYQPVTTKLSYSDDPVMQRAGSPYNEIFINQRYDFMSGGHDAMTHPELLEASGLSADVFSIGSGTSGHTITQGFGPYQLEPGDSVHIVLAGACSGISRAKNREVGGNWVKYENGTGTPRLIKPDGTETTDYNEYKKEWVWTCKDSLYKAFHMAIANYESGYTMPQAPPPPEEFTVKSGGDRISLSWADNATSSPNFDGYVIYRAQGSVMQPKSKYEFLYECDASNVIHEFDDVNAVRGFDYYYYIQSKAKNPGDPSHPLYSGMFWTLTSLPATLQRPHGLAIDEVRVVPNPYDIRARALQFGDEYQYDRIAFYELPPFCKIRIFTERGDLIYTRDHMDGSGDELWDSMTSSGQIIVSGIYILVVEVTGDTYADQDIYASHDYYDPKTDKLVYAEGDLKFKEGDLMYTDGQKVYRKFVVIR